MHSMLAARSNFSIGESIMTVERLVEGAKSVGATAVALTDTMSVTGMIDFTNKAKKAGIKPIIGCRLRLVDDPSWRKTKEDKKAPPEYFATVYVRSEKGLKEVFKLLTKANSDERFYNVPKLGFEDLHDALSTLSSDDLVITTGDQFSVLAHPKADTIIEGWLEQLGATGIYAQLTPIDTPYFDVVNKRAIAAATKFGLLTLVARPTLYAEGDQAAAEIMTAVTRNVRLEDLWHYQPAFHDLHPMGTKDLVAHATSAARRLIDRFGVSDAGAWFKQGLVATADFVNKVAYEWSKAPVSLPKMAADEFATVVEECRKGWSHRFGSSVFGHKPSAEELRDVYKPRLAYELEVLKKLNFSGYFLLVQDVVRFAKSNGILVGPGRGSVGGSLVAYLMGITDCDPIRFGLLFERFINPDRIDLPDADLDFMSTRRGEIIDYLTSKYGEKRVAGVSNFIALGPASAIRDVAKAFGLPESLYACTKLMPKKHGAHIPLKEAADMVPEIGEFRDKFGPIWETSLKVEGVTKTLGRHAAGIVVGGCDLVERGVIERRKDGATVNWDKRIVEDMGLVKMDILGLETLDLIKLTLDYIRRRHSKKVDLMRIPLDDEKVLANFAKALTVGIFQFESGGMRRLLKELGKDGTITFDDITAATALYRPGPMESGMMDSYWRRKQGIESVEYDHPLMEPILAPTFGVMVYQEQVMQVSRVIAGYSAPDADKLRKIMGKKLPEEMKKERSKFVEGCVKTIGCDEEWAGELFDKIEGFAGYGFNKSHSVEYTLISYQSMWLKTYYPVEFFAAALTLMDQDKLPAILKDAERFGVELMLPDVNLSTDRFEIVTDTKLAMPLSRIKGVGENTVKAILTAREDGPFKSKADFIARVEKRRCNIGHVTKLEKVGAFAAIEPGSLPAKHPDRIRDQRELIPGLITDIVPVHRDMERDKFAKAKLGALVSEYRASHAEDGTPVKPALGRDARFMVIFDCPSAPEERKGQMTMGDGFSWQATCEALHEAGLSTKDAYWTALIKRPKEGKQVSPEEIKTYAPYLHREIEILKPPVIVMLGSATVRHFIPDFKGKASDAAGKVIYSEKLDANLIVGFSPGEVYHDPDKQIPLNEVFATAASLAE